MSRIRGCREGLEGPDAVATVNELAKPPRDRFTLRRTRPAPRRPRQPGRLHVYDTDPLDPRNLFDRDDAELDGRSLYLVRDVVALRQPEQSFIRFTVRYSF